MLKKTSLFLFPFLVIGNVFVVAQTYLLKENFEATSLPPGWTLYNSKSGSGSGYDWMVNNTAPIEGARSLQYMYNTNPTVAADAWAFTPTLTLNAGTTYYISFKQKVSTSSYAENLKVTVGTAATKAGQTITLLDLPGVNNTAVANRVALFTPTVTQDYYFAFNCYSLPDKFKLSIDSINIYTYSCTLPSITTQPVAQSECVGGNASFTVSVSGSGVSYKWQKAAIDIPGAQGTSLYFNNLATSDGGNYNVIATNTCGSVTSDIVPLFVKGLPVISQITGPDKVCMNAGIQLNNATTNGLWSSNNAAILTVDPNGNVTPIAVGNTDIIYVVTGSNGCKDSVQKVITVNSLPIVNSIQNVTDICVKEITTLANNSFGGLWYSSDTNIISINAFSGNVNGISAGMASIAYIITDNNGCTDSATASINVNPLPHVTILPTGTIKFCSGDSIILTDNTVGSVLSYQWLNDTSIYGATLSSLVVKESGFYSLAVMDSNGCIDTSNTDSVVVFPIPNPIINRNGLILSTGNYANYEWYHDGQKINTATDQYYTINKNGMYYVIVTDSNGCVKQSAIDTVSDVGITEIETGDKDILIYPNPVSSRIYMNTSKPVNITFYTIEGKTIMQKEQVITLDVSSLKEGIYIMKMTDVFGNLIKMQKITKMD